MDDKVRQEEEDRAARKVRTVGKPVDNDSPVGKPAEAEEAALARVLEWYGWCRLE